MCGIFGFTVRTDDPSRLLKTMGQVQLHRGPDGDGYFTDNNVSLGMRRLSIIDLKHGGQPLFNESRSVVVICNGEIYNFKELREELIGMGHHFRTGSDVEVIPHLYEQHGIQFVDKLNGMYAMALYDRMKGKLFLIRDRLGVKPLYYALLGDAIIFSSELKSILAAFTLDLKLDLTALSTYLDLLYIPSPMSPFKNIRKMDSASYLAWENNSAHVVKYWDPNLALDRGKSESDWIDEIDEVLHDSINLELRSDVPVGTFLSGGIDSSLVTAFAAQNSPHALSTFHMRWKDVDGKIDESIYADMVSKRYSTNNVTKNVSQIDVPALLPKLVWHLEEPFSDAAFVPTYILANFAADKVKVILSGAGGDELFGGYYHHREQSLIKSMITKVLFGRHPAVNYYDMWKHSYFHRWTSIFPWFIADSFKEQFESKYTSNKASDKLGAIMLADISCYLQDDILFLTDKMTMAASIECRVPLLDHRLVELSLKIPSSFKVRNGLQKDILKKLGQRYLPSEVLYRDKEGFGSPVWLWVNEYKDLYFDPLLEEGFLMKNGLINRSFLLRLTSTLSPRKHTCWLYWQILILEIWCRLFIEGARHDEIF